jgi:hypothetical protein
VLEASASGNALQRLRAAIEAVLPLDAEGRRGWQVWVAMWGIASRRPAESVRSRSRRSLAV